MMVDITAPKTDDIICDPASGTCGFLMSANEYVREHYKGNFSKKGFLDHYNNKMFTVFDFDSTMLRIGTMNMLLHGIENPHIEGSDSLSQEADFEEAFTLILANPPFKGNLDYDSVAKNLLQVVKTKKTELLFLALFIRLLKTGGRCACIVPDGVLFGSSNAHKQLRKILVDDQKLDAVISMPSVVFKPYTGVSTAVLIFTKTNSGGTDNIWFYDMKADGFSLDDKRTPLDTDKHESNNIPDIIKRYHKLKDEVSRKRIDQSFTVPAKEIQENGYDLSINRYKEIVYEEVKYDSPEVIIAELEELEKKSLIGLGELKGLLE